MVYWRFVLKNLRTNIQNHVPLLAGMIFNLAFVFCLLFLGAVMRNSDSLWIAYHYEELAGNIHLYTEVGIIAGVFLTINLSLPYIKARIREYGVLLILGIKKKKMFLLLGLEYLAMWGFTFIAGVLSGIILSAIVYAGLRQAGFWAEEIAWWADVAMVCGEVALLSLLYIACGFFYVMIRTANRNLSELMNEEARADRLKSSQRSIRTGILGVCLIFISLTVRFSVEYWPVFLKQIVNKDLLAFVSCIVGIYFLLSSGMMVVLAYQRRNPARCVRNFISVRSMSFRVSSYRNIIFAVLLIHYTALFYVGENAGLSADVNVKAYEWRYPHNIVGSLDVADAEEWKEICRKEGIEGDIQTVPYTEVQSENGVKYIGMPCSEYEKMTDERISLEKDEVLLCIQHDETDASNALADWEEEDSIALDIQNGGKEYAIRMKDVKIFSIGDLGVGADNRNGIVFEDGEYGMLSEAAGESRILLLQDLEKENQAVVSKRLDEFRKGHPQAAMISRKEALDMERVVDETANAVYRFCGILLVVAGLSMLSIRFFSEIPALKKKYQFLSDIGMTEDQMRREVRKEVWQLVWIPALSGIFMAVVYHMDILLSFILQNSKYHFFENGGAVGFAWEQSRAWLCIVTGFCLIQAIYGSYMVQSVRKRVLPVTDD